MRSYKKDDYTPPHYIHPIQSLVKHLNLLYQGFEVEADEPLCDVIEHIETGGWVPRISQVKKALKKAKLPLEAMDLTYVRTIGVFKEWKF